MKRSEIITLFTLFASVFIMVGVLRYLNLYEGLTENGEEEEEADSFESGGDAPQVTPPSDPPSAPSSGPVPATAGGDSSVLKFTNF